MTILLPLFRLTVQYEKLDWLSNFIVKLGGKKNYNKFYELPC